MEVTLKSGELRLPAYPRRSAHRPGASFSTNGSAEGCLRQGILRKVRGDPGEVLWRVDSTEKWFGLASVFYLGWDSPLTGQTGCRFPLRVEILERIQGRQKLIAARVSELTVSSEAAY